MINVECVAYAEKTDYYDFENAVLTASDRVLGVAVEKADGRVTVAYITVPVFFKSEGDEIERLVRALAAEYFAGFEITVTRDATTFYKIIYTN